MTKDYMHKGRGVSEMKAHLVLCTKYRRDVMGDDMLDFLEGVFRRTLEKWEGRLIEFNGECDHIHVLFQYTPQTQISKLIANLKTVSSRLVRQEYEDYLAQKYWKGAFWSGSYFIASWGGVTVDQIKAYVQSQDRPLS